MSGTVGGIHGASGHTLDQAGDFASGIANLTALGITYTGTIGAGTFTATSAGGKTGTSGSVTIAVGTARAALSTVAGDPAAVPADDSTTATITVTLIDVGGNPVPGKTVALSQALSGGGTSHSTITPGSGSTGSDGVVTFAVKNAVNETVVYTATDTSETVTLTQTASVLFSAVDAGNSSVAATPASITADGSTTSTLTPLLPGSPPRGPRRTRWRRRGLGWQHLSARTEIGIHLDHADLGDFGEATAGAGTSSAAA